MRQPGLQRGLVLRDLLPGPVRLGALRADYRELALAGAVRRLPRLSGPRPVLEGDAAYPRQAALRRDRDQRVPGQDRLAPLRRFREGHAALPGRQGLPRRPRAPTARTRSGVSGTPAGSPATRST
ncbi:MAG: hypothetical protein MZV63_13690 [Marinilabiliales bacterium]|nr:hypothetical protein [Marinilabiliales bacterium]